MRIKQNIGLRKSRLRFRQSTNLKYATRVCTETNTPNCNRERDYINVFWDEIKFLAKTKLRENKFEEPTNLK